MCVYLLDLAMIWLCAGWLLLLCEFIVEWLGLVSRVPHVYACAGLHDCHVVWFGIVCTALVLAVLFCFQCLLACYSCRLLNVVGLILSSLYYMILECITSGFVLAPWQKSQLDRGFDLHCGQRFATPLRTHASWAAPGTVPCNNKTHLLTSTLRGSVEYFHK